MSIKTEIETVIDTNLTNTDITALSAEVASGGTGYTVGDDITLVGGTGTASVFNVDTVSSGVVTTVSVITAGLYSIVPTNPVSTTGGTGTGVTLTVNFSGITAIEHRDTLKDNADSLKENFYAKVFTDNESGGTFFTLQTIGSATFDMTIIKQGREVTVSFTVNSILPITRLGSFTAGELTIISGATYYSVGQNLSTGIEGIEVRDVSGTTSIFFTNSIAASNIVNFTIIYNTAS